jgi:hypothetical protein
MTIAMTVSRRLGLGSILGLALLAGCASAPAPQPAAPPAAAAAAPGVRTPDAILADAIAATGGLSGWNAHRTVHMKVTIALKAMAVEGPAEHFQTNTSKSLVKTTVAGVGQVLEGTNGQVFWSQDPVNGTRLLDGAEAEQARIEASWNSDIEAHKLFPKIELATDGPAGLECLVMTPRIGPPLRNCYDRQTHLQVSQEGTKVTPQGDIPFRSTVSDWRTVGGLKIPYLSEGQMGPVTVVTTVNAVSLDEPMDEKMFEPPVAPQP